MPLRPGGVWIFIDHAIEQNNSIRKALQKLVEPVLGDCKFKDIKSLIERGPFKTLIIKEHKPFGGFLSFVNPIFVGYGTKNKL